MPTSIGGKGVRGSEWGGGCWLEGGGGEHYLRDVIDPFTVKICPTYRRAKWEELESRTVLEAGCGHA